MERQRFVDVGDLPEKGKTQRKGIFQFFAAEAVKRYQVVMSHDDDGTVNVIRKKVGGKKGLSQGHAAVFYDRFRELRSGYLPVFRAKGAKPPGCVMAVSIEIKGLPGDSTEVREMATPAREGIETDLEYCGIWRVALAGIEKLTSPLFYVKDNRCLHKQLYSKSWRGKQ
jgi:hypothetical protein